MVIAMSAAAAKQAVCSRSRANRRGTRYTHRPAAARPKSATEMAKKAKWYHMTTERTRVSETSSRRIEAVTAKSPAATQGDGPSAAAIGWGRAGRDAKDLSGRPPKKG